MKRYMVFGGDSYYAFGGMSDFMGFYDDLEEAKKQPQPKDADGDPNPECNWWHVFDTHTNKIVYQKSSAYGSFCMSEDYQGNGESSEVVLPWGLRKPLSSV